MDRMLLRVDSHKTGGSTSTELTVPRQTSAENDHPIHDKEVEAAVQSLKKGKSAGVDNIPTELANQAGAEAE